MLERAGFHVDVPRDPVCCGRPLYDYGMLPMAARWLQHCLRTLDGAIAAGTPVVGLEPSCVAVFRDEMRQLLPDDERARRLAGQTFMLGEFLQQHAGNFRYPTLHRKAIVHGHCHHKAIMKMTGDAHVLDAIGLDYEMLDSGCCGMAGSFGFERVHYDVSMKVGELVLLPAVRRAPATTLLIANGFSCRQQIAQTTERRALHLAEILQMAMTDGPAGPPGEYPERRYAADYAAEARHASKRALMPLGIVAIIAGAFIVGRWVSNATPAADRARLTARQDRPSS